MEPLYDGTQQLPGYDGYFGYRVERGYVEYVDIDTWAGTNNKKYWSYQEFYKEFHNQKDNLMEKAVIEFIITNKLVKTID